jgi:hypothetical protein
MGKMQNQIDEQQKANQLNKEYLIGLAEQTARLESKIEGEIRMIANTMHSQISNIHEIINHLSKEMVEQQKLDAIYKALQEYRSLQLSASEKIMLMILQRIKEWENILIKLSEGKIPQKLISYNELKQLLKSLSTQLDYKFQLAIDEENLPLYYTLPMVNYATQRVNNTYKLLVHLKIPLKLKEVINHFPLISPQSNSFPCYQSKCFGGKVDSGEDLQVFDLAQTSYLVNPKTYKIQYEVNLDFLDCYVIKHNRICFTYQPSTLLSPSSCTMAIYDWDEENIVKFCELKPAKLDTYRATPLQANQYILHKDIIPSFQQFCQTGLGEEIKLEHWMEVLSIPEGCEVFIASTKQRLLGPFSKILRAHSFVNRITYESTLILKLEAKYSNMSIKISEALSKSTTKLHRMIRDIEDKVEQNQQLSNQLMTNLSPAGISELMKFNQDLKSKLEETVTIFNNKMTTYTYSSTLWSYFSLFADTIQMITSLLFFVTILSYSHSLGLMYPTIIIMKSKAIEAFTLIDIQLFPEITIDVLNDTIAISFILNIIYSFIFIVLIVLYVIFGVFRKIIVSEHDYKAFIDSGRIITERGDGRDSKPFSIMLDLEYESYHIRYIKKEYIHLRIYMKGMFSHFIKGFDPKYSTRFWHVEQGENGLYLKLSDEIYLTAYNSRLDRVMNQSLDINIPINCLKNDSNLEATAFSKRGNCGRVTINVLRPYSRRAFVESSAPPLLYTTPV